MAELSNEDLTIDAVPETPNEIAEAKGAERAEGTGAESTEANATERAEANAAERAEANAAERAEANAAERAEANAAERAEANAAERAQAKGEQAKGAQVKGASAESSPKTQDKKEFKFQPTLQVSKNLGEGFSGSVYQVKDKLDEKKYAVKEIILGKANPSSALEEVKALAAIERKGHFGIVEYFHPWKDTTVNDFGTEVETLCYKMELCGMTLGKWLEKPKQCKDRSRLTMLGIFYQLLATLAYLHHKKDGKKKGFMHRDLKPENVFVPAEGEYEVKVGDFGLAIAVDKAIQGKRKGKPSPYAAPEQYSNVFWQYSDPKICNEKVDMYSLGIILLDLLVPFESPDERTAALMEPRKGNFSWFERQCKQEDLELAKWLCMSDPQERPSAAEVIGSPHCKQFMKQVNGRSDPLTKHGVSRLEKYAALEQDPRSDRLTLLPSDLKTEYYDAVIIYHEDEEDLAKDYRDKIKALTMKNGCHPKVAFLRDLDHPGRSELRNAAQTMDVCSIVFLLVTEMFCKLAEKDRLIIDIFMTDSNMYPADDRKHYVIPIFTKKKTDLANHLTPDIKALEGIKCHRRFDADMFIKSLSQGPYEHTRRCREDDQMLQQTAYLVQKRMEELKI